MRAIFPTIEEWKPVAWGAIEERDFGEPSIEITARSSFSIEQPIRSSLKGLA
jgi:hypothetical protein